MRPKLEMADIFRRHGDNFRAAQGNRLSLDQRKVMAAIEVCRTPALGAHVERCQDCGETRISYNSCRNRQHDRLAHRNLRESSDNGDGLVCDGGRESGGGLRKP